MDQANRANFKFEVGLLSSLLQSAQQFFSKIGNRFFPVIDTFRRIFHRCRQVVAGIQKWLKIRPRIEVRRYIVLVCSDDHVLDFRVVSKNTLKSRTVQRVQPGTNWTRSSAADEAVDISQDVFLLHVRNADSVVPNIAKDDVDSDRSSWIDSCVEG